MWRSGKILSSKITAKKGVKAGDIGSSTSSACQFLVGVDHSYDRKIEAGPPSDSGR